MEVTTVSRENCLMRSEMVPSLAAVPTVLVAMKDGRDRTAISCALESGGWGVTLAATGWELLALLGGALLLAGSQVRPTLVLLDPELAGPQRNVVLARIQRYFPGLPVLLVLPMGDSWCWGSGVIGILRGPFAAEEIALAAHRATRDR
jgi:hypothetical protein